MTEQEMCIEIAYRDFVIQNKSVINAFKRIQFPESGIRFIFSEGYKSKEDDIQRQKGIEKQILELIKNK